MDSIQPSQILVKTKILYMYHSFSHKNCLFPDHLLPVILSSSFLGWCSVHVLGSGVHKMNFGCFFRESHPNRMTMRWSLMSHKKVCGRWPTEHFLYSDNREKHTFTLCWNPKKIKITNNQQHWSKCNLNSVLIKIWWLDKFTPHLSSSQNLQACVICALKLLHDRRRHSIS